MHAKRPAGPAVPGSAVQFLAVLREELAELKLFNTLLQTEQNALVQGDADRVGQLADEKAEHVALLGRLGEQRSRYLAAQKLESNAAGMAAWLQRNASLAANAKAVWRDLLVKAQKAQLLNETNGMLIANSLQQNRIKLSALQAAAAPDGVYRADGQMRGLRSLRSYSQA